MEIYSQFKYSTDPFWNVNFMEPHVDINNSSSCIGLCLITLWQWVAIFCHPPRKYKFSFTVITFPFIQANIDCG